MVRGTGKMPTGRGVSTLSASCQNFDKPHTGR